jgi:hypothetical protein
LIGSGALLLARVLDYRHPRLLALAFTASPPAFLVGYYGQIGALVYGAAILAWWAHRRGHAATLGLAVVASCVKPQLGLFTVLPLLWGAPRRAWHEAVPHVMTRVCFWVSVLLVTTTPVMALSTASIPFRLLPLGLVLWTICGLIIERWRWHRHDHTRQLVLCVSRPTS